MGQSYYNTAVADAMILKIHIIESDSNYREITLVQPANATSDIRSIYIGHMGQMHYVSTCNSFEQDSNHRNANDIQQTIPNDSVQNEFSENSHRQRYRYNYKH